MRRSSLPAWCWRSTAGGRSEQMFAELRNECALAFQALLSPRLVNAIVFGLESGCAGFLAVPCARSRLRDRNAALSGRLRGGPRLFENRDHSCQNLVQDAGWHSFDPLSSPCPQIERARLVASNYAGRIGASQRNRKADAPGKVPAGSDRQDHRQLCRRVEIIGRDNQNRPPSLLLMAQCWVERHHVDIAALQISSPPRAGASIHSRSSAVCG